MPKLILSFVCMVLFAPLGVHAQATDEDAAEAEAPAELRVGDVAIVFSEAYDITDGRLYYGVASEGEIARLVASTHDTNGDDREDLWLIYDETETVRQEIYDTNDDGVADTTIYLDAEGTTIKIEGDGASRYERELPTPFVPTAFDTNTGDVVGDLSDISIQEKSNSWIFFVILLIAGALVYFFLKRQK